MIITATLSHNMKEVAIWIVTYVPAEFSARETSLQMEASPDSGYLGGCLIVTTSLISQKILRLNIPSDIRLF